MRRRSFLAATSGAILTAGLAGSGCSSNNQSEDLEPPSVANRTDLAAVADTVDEIRMDGALTDARWGEPLWSTFTTLYDLKEVPNTALHVVHDNSNLYVGVRVGGAAAATVSHINLVVRGAEGGVWRTVTVEVRKVSPTPKFTWGGAAEAAVDARTAFHAADELVTCEIALPLSELGITGRLPGSTLGLNVVIDHKDMTRGVSTVAPTRTSHNMFNGGSTALQSTDIVDEDRVATVHLGELHPITSGLDSTHILQTIEVVIRYIDFTHKLLTIQLPESSMIDRITILWKSPNKSWSSCQLLTQELVDSQLAVNFDHPTPDTHGQYRIRISIPTRAGVEQVVVATFDREDLIRAGDSLIANLPRTQGATTSIRQTSASDVVATLMELIPDRAGFHFCGVPDSPDLHPNRTFTWSIDQPDKIIAVSTGTAYPNKNYPEDRKLSVVNALGETVEYPYHQDALGKRYFLSAHLWYQQRDYVYSQLEQVADDDPLGAARLLHRLATSYQRWVPTNEYSWFNRPVDREATPRNFYWGGLWDRWSVSSLRPLKSIGAALKAIERTDAFDVLSDEVGRDVRRLIIEQTLRPTIDLFHTFTRQYSNYDYPSYLALISLAKALGDSSLVHETVDWAKEYVRRGLLLDGFWRETALSYHLQVVNGLRQVVNGLAGWRDAEGYRSPRSGMRFIGLDLMADLPLLRGSARIPNVLVYPDGKLLPMADTWANAVAAEPDLAAGSVVFGGGGVARLSRGGTAAEGNPSQVNVLFTPKYGHNHRDALGLSLYAEGQELLPDLGYTHTRFRRWTCSQIAHNTVTVDAADMDVTAGKDGGSLEVFDTAEETVQVVRVDFGSAYRQTSRYLRETWSIEHPGTDRQAGYVLDLFRVVGGERHEFALNGDANRDAELTTTAELSEYGPYLLPAGVTVTEPKTETAYGDAEGHYYGYIHIQQVQRAALADGRYDVTLATTVDRQPAAGAHVLGLAGDQADLFVGQSPSIRPTRLNGTSGDTNDQAEQFWMPKLVVRREGNDLRSDFVTMIEPLAAGAQTSVVSIESLAHNGSVDDLAVKVTHVDGTVDVIISSLDPATTVTAEGVSVTGKLGFARIVAGAATKLHLVGGTTISAPGTELAGTGAATGPVTGTRRTFTGDPVNALITTAAVPEWVAGHTVVVAHPDGKTHPYPIKAVTTDGSNTLIELDGVDPGFMINSDNTSEMAFTPFTTWRGTTTFRVENSTTA